MSVYIIDPNDMNSNKYITNSIPDYEDMYIDVKFSGKARNRSIINTTSSGRGFSINSKYTINGGDANFLGDTNGFTTEWVDDFNKSTTDNGFGIEKINIKVDSAYVPQVNIKFVDVRGMGFFNDENSPYRILFDFPPPIFNLSIKGYYGKTLNYQLHLTKYTTEFLAESGKFVIDANFVAVTFAPLSDLPFRYAAQFGYMFSEGKNTSDVTTEPKNILDLIEKVKDIYEDVKNNENTGVYNELINSNVSNLNKIADLESHIKSLPTTSDDLKLIKPFFAVIKGNNEIIKLNDISEYFQYKNSDPTHLSDKPILCITCNPIIENSTNITSVFNRFNVGSPQYMPFNNATTRLNEYIKNNFSSVVSTSSAKMSIFDLKNSSSPTLNNGSYYVMDITNIYDSLIREKNNITQSYNKNVNNFNELINVNVVKKLGMNPSINNIFKVICNDVDVFFNELKRTADEAERKHNGNYSDILIKSGEYVDNEDHIYAFPLIINNENGRETKISPDKLSKRLSIATFPEMDLINKFINSFRDYNNDKEVNEVKRAVDDMGGNKWIPISPLDYNESDNPYSGLNSFDEILYMFINRYYLLKDNMMLTKFDGVNKNKYIDLYARAEANNIYVSILNDEKLLGVVKNGATNYKNNVDGFFDHYLNTDGKIKELLTNNNAEKMKLLQNFDFAIQKADSNYFKGISIGSTDMVERTTGENTNNPIDKFMNSNKWSWFSNLFKDSDEKSINYLKFSNKNLIYFNDIENDDVDILNTRYVFDEKSNYDQINKYDEYYDLILNRTIKNENIITDNKSRKNRASKLNAYGDYYGNFVKGITNSSIAPLLSGSSLDETYALVKDLLILSNFGYITSPFNMSPNFINEYIFSLPSAISVPNFYAQYMGLICTISNDSDLENDFYNYVLDFDRDILVGLRHVFADINDAKKISPHDRNIFMLEYGTYVSDRNEIYSEIDKIYSIPESEKNKKNIISVFDPVLRKLLFDKKKIIYNNTSLSFKVFNNDNDVPTKYTSIESEINSGNGDISLFFNTFFNEIHSLTSEKNSENKNDVDMTTSDVDILTQLYYSFKNLNDKWVCDDEFNKTLFDGNLIGKFSFVDRTFNEIGDTTMLNLEILQNILDSDQNISVFSVMAQLLSLNGFEFFPLQNFIVAQDNESWNSSFKIDTSGDVISNPKFVCMYIGGGSSFTNGVGNGFKNDGVENMEIDALDLKNSNVNAFKVKFGKQAQSMFSDVKIDSKEYPETNESIQILSKLAGDSKNQAQIPKGQNLYNLYENRAYKATVTGMGNACIQPTHYFQLENVPLFSGAYIILNVEHNIEPNKMTTTFSGTKILRYPIPRVNQPAAVFGFGVGLNSAITDKTNAPITFSNNGNNIDLSEVNNTNRLGQNSFYKFRLNDYISLSSSGVEFIKNTINNPMMSSYDKNYCNQNNYMLHGRRTYNLAFSNDEPTTVYQYNGGKYVDNESWVNDLINIINKYAKEYNLDANVVAALLFAESGYVMWNYPPEAKNPSYNSSAVGLSQFTQGTFYDFAISKNYNSMGVVNFTQEEIDRFLFGITNPDKYNSKLYTNFNRNDAYDFRKQLFQNIVNNPDLMVKLACRFLALSKKYYGGLLSSTLVSYKRGFYSSKSSYLDAINFLNSEGGGELVVNDASKYVFDIFNTLNKNFGIGYADLISNKSFDPEQARTDSENVKNNV